MIETDKKSDEPERTPESVFPSVGRPYYTYVERDAGRNERNLLSGLREKGQICIVTGPSKTGKTSLYKQVLPTLKKSELVIRCSGNLTPDEFWASALERLDFSRIAETSKKFGIDLTAKIGVSGEAGWSWLAKAMASVGFSVSSSGEYAVQKEFARSKLGARHLLPLLQQLPIQLIVEDFHYLAEDAKREVFQQWKSFTDEGVSVVVISTTHHTVDIARSNPDLTGRMRLVDVGKWGEADLKQIPVKGFPELGMSISDELASRIAVESVGLPIIAQQICQNSCHEIQAEMTEDDILQVQLSHIDRSLNYVADNLYSSHENDYQQLIIGPRKRARKHATYEKILAYFALDPICYSLSYGDLTERVAKLQAPNEDPIPAASINAALRAMGKFQERSKISLLEWQETERRLYIIEPSFLFYLRQKLDNFAPNDHDVGSVLRALSRLLDSSRLKTWTIRDS